MKRGENKRGYNLTIILLIIILFIMLLGLNLNKFSSFTIKSKEIIKVTPEIIKPGQYLTIEINPPVKGLHKKISFCDANNKCKVHFNIRCGSFKCTKYTKDEFKTYSNWDGIYYAKIFNYETKNYEKAYFTME